MLPTDTAALIIESIWPSPAGAQYSVKAPVIPLHIFVKETLRRSRTTLTTLQLALYYIYKVRNQVLAAQEKIRQDQIHHLQQQQHRVALQHGLPLSPNDSIDALSDEEFKQRDYFNAISVYAHSHSAKHALPLTPPCANNTPASLSPLSLPSSASTSPILAKSEPVGCGRRMFLAALILASKFQQDRTYSNKAWSKISGLPVAEINLNEITFLTLIDYRLFVSHAVFQKWVTILTEKGRVRDRSALSRGCSMVNAETQPKRRSSIQYCNNTLPSRMTCVTASSLEQQHPYKQHQEQPQTASATFKEALPHLPSFSLFLEQQKPIHTTASGVASAQFEFAPVGVPALPQLSMDSTKTNSGLLQSETLPRQQQGMGAYLTHRWVQAQRREFLRSRMQAMGYTFSESPNSAPLVPPSMPQPQPQPSMSSSQLPLPVFEQQQQQMQYGMMLNNYQNNGTTFNLEANKSVEALEEKRRHALEFLPSPASSMSPQALAGSKRRVDKVDASLEENSAAMRSRTRRRLSVSFLVDC
ncbi:hypothetical protein BGZ98_000150 [Dissophora globulifera]|nr:hypothetical protein BGZ98_000150 [Dissophora globulifera]